MRYTRLLIGTLVTVGLLAVLAVSPAYADPPFDPPGLERAMAAQEAHTDALLRTQGVVGTAVGLGAAGQPAVKIYTESAGVAGLPRTLDGVPVVVQVTGKIFALHHACGHDGGPPGSVPFPCDEPPADPPEDPGTGCSTTEVCPPPVPIGVSTGNVLECSAGTIGTRVKAGSNVYALSNNHVYALENSATIGSMVLQPGLFDTGCNVNPDDAIGTLYDFEPIDFSTSANNTIDAAIALSSTANLGNATPSNGYGTPKTATVSASVGQAVQKYGRTTELTKGTITAINATVLVGYTSGTARFVDQVIVESKKPFLKGGDSGSLLVVDGGSDDRKPVGLLFAGNRSGKLAVANRIDLVLPALGATGVTIDGE